METFFLFLVNFQETKLTRQDLSVDLTFAEGYEAFLSCTRGNSRGRFAYSGKICSFLHLFTKKK